MSAMSDVDRMVKKASEHNIRLTVSDFRMIDEELTIDGMPADEWLDVAAQGKAGHLK